MNITQLVQKAAVNYLRAIPLTTIPGTGERIYPGVEKAKMLLPRVVIQCNRFEDEASRSGNVVAVMIILVRSNADDTTEEQHHARAKEVFSHFHYSPLQMGILLSRAWDGFCADLVIRQSGGWDVQERSWESHEEYAVTCCARDTA